MSLGAAFEADAQLAEGCQPGVRSLHHPAMAPQPVVARDAPAGDAALDTSSPEMFPTAREVVALVGMQLVGPTARSAALADQIAIYERRWDSASGPFGPQAPTTSKAYGIENRVTLSQDSNKWQQTATKLCNHIRNYGCKVDIDD